MHSTLQNLHIGRSQTKRRTVPGKQLTRAIHIVMSIYYNEANCTNKQAGASLYNIKWLVVSDTKSTLDIVDATFTLYNAVWSRSIPSVLRCTLHRIGALSDKTTLRVKTDNPIKIKRVSDCKPVVEKHLRICCFNPRNMIGENSL